MKSNIRSSSRKTHFLITAFLFTGLGCAFLRFGETDLGIKLFAFVQQNPKTPPLYIDLARRWYQGYEGEIQKASEAGFDQIKLEGIIAKVFSMRLLFRSA